MSSSSQKWFKEIENEIINRNKECNSLDEKKVYEYDRHEINPYKLKDVNKFKRDYTFDKKKNCRLIIDNIKQITDKNNRYYKNVFTQDRCNTTNGFWVGNTINRNTGYDSGNCWVDGDDAKSNRYVDEVLETAKKEGWVLEPQWHNPGSQEYIEPDIQDDMLDYIKNN